MARNKNQMNHWQQIEMSRRLSDNTLPQSFSIRLECIIVDLLAAQVACFSNGDNSMAHDDWESHGDGWWTNERSDGSVLIWHESWGQKNYKHLHMSKADALRQFGVYKPVREYYKENISSNTYSGG
jgi:hypothetical protein